MCIGSTAAKPLIKPLKRQLLGKTGLHLYFFRISNHIAPSFFEIREDLQEFRSRAAASAMSRNPPTAQIAVKEKEDSLFVPGTSKQMSILSRLGIKVWRLCLQNIFSD